MRKTRYLMPSLILLALSAGCGSVRWKAANVPSSDFNRDQERRREEMLDRDNAAAFIAAHPELDDETRKELRDGTITPHEALERLKKNQSEKKSTP